MPVSYLDSSPLAGVAIFDSGDLIGVLRATATLVPGEPEFPVSLETEIEIEFTGRYYAVTQIRSTEITGELLRQIPIAKLVPSVAYGLIWERRPPANERERGLLVGGDVYYHAIPDPSVAANGPTDAALSAAARIYSVAQLAGGQPTNAVASRLGLTRPTAGRWVGQARERGFLAPVGASPTIEIRTSDIEWLADFDADDVQEGLRAMTSHPSRLRTADEPVEHGRLERKANN